MLFGLSLWQNDIGTRIFCWQKSQCVFECIWLRRLTAAVAASAVQAENVKCLEDNLKPNTIEFDFLGKDSVQYTKEVEVAAAVYRNIGKWTQKTVNGKRESICRHTLPNQLLVTAQLGVASSALLTGFENCTAGTARVAVVLASLLADFEHCTAATAQEVTLSCAAGQLRRQEGRGPAVRLHRRAGPEQDAEGVHGGAVCQGVLNAQHQSALIFHSFSQSCVWWLSGDLKLVASDDAKRV